MGRECVTADLQKEAMLPLREAKGLRIECLEGALWITQDRDRRDTVLEPGGSFVADRPGTAIVLALRTSRVVLSRA